MADEPKISGNTVTPGTANSIGIQIGEPKPTIEDKFKAEIASVEGKAQEDLAQGLGYIRIHMMWFGIVIALVIGLILGHLI